MTVAALPLRALLRARVAATAAVVATIATALVAPALAATAVAIPAAVPVAAAVSRFAARFAAFARRFRSRRRRGNGRLAAKPAQHRGQPAGRVPRRRLCNRRGRGYLHRNGCRLGRRDSLDGRLLPRFLRFLLHLLDAVRLLGLRDEVEAQGQGLALV
ncbi:MAG: hypothetical protein OEW98_10175, partial [Betaproteobacteria bacterium]|nr:hypothetical protein [Betaproteobacteria bacterium]